jgi:branched-chain amino acid transport system substrate-binding protein
MESLSYRLVTTTLRAVITLLTLTATATTARAQISDGVVKIGVLNSDLGPYAACCGPGSRVAAFMAVEDFAAERKGLKVEIVFADHQYSVDVGTAIARRWFGDEKVDVIVDVPTSPITLAISQIAREKGKALLVSSGGTSDLTGTACSPNTIHWTYDNWAMANSTGKALVKSGAKTWFLVAVDDAFGRNSSARSRASWWRAAGRCSASSAIHSRRRTFLRSCCRRRPLKPASSGSPILGLT